MRLRSIFRHLSLLALFASICVASFSVNATGTVIKSPNDAREYERLVLPNKLRVLLISDPKIDKAGAALDVLVGTSSDPEGREGLTHFLEHMLFLGTEKYPAADEFRTFIASQGGRYNAYTAFEHTNYYFDIGKEHLAPALDRFAQFFIAPLFTADYVTRERKAVHSEYSAKLKDDGRRILDARKQLINPNHPFSRFTVGSLQTLADLPHRTVRDELVEFYQTHYSANLMTLTVLGKEPLAVLKQLVTEKFSSVKNANSHRRDITEPLFTSKTLPARMDVVPVKDDRSMFLTFPIPSVAKHYQSKPTHYIASLLGDEAEGSLLSLLRKKGWAEALSAGAGVRDLNEAIFSVSIRLTEAGLQHVSEIASHVFQYLRLIKQEGIEQWRFNERRQLRQLKFQYQERSQTIKYVSALAHRLQVYPAVDVLRGPFSMDVYAPALIRDYLGHLEPDNVLLTVKAPGLATDKTSPWFKAPYKITQVAEKILQQWRHAEIDPALSLPKENVFLPGDLSVKPVTGPMAKPSLVKKQPGFEFWFQHSDSYRVPRADLYFAVRSESANNSPQHAVLTDLYVALVKDQLTEFTYPARLAGLEYNIYTHTRGFSARISGYNDKQHLLLNRIVQTLRNPVIETARFESLKSERVRNLRNRSKRTPYKQVMSEVQRLLVRPYWTPQERIAALRPLAAEDLRRFIPQLLGKISVVALSHGNVYREEATELARILDENLRKEATSVAVPEARVVKLSNGDYFMRDLTIEHPDSAIAVYFQGADRDYRNAARFALLGQMLTAPFYHELRTEKQLGYVVLSRLMPLFEVPGIGFIVQSPTTDPIALMAHIEGFISSYRSALTDMSDEQFEKYKRGLLTRVQRREKKLSERSNRYWAEINQEYYDFDYRQQLAAAIRLVTKADFEKFYEGFLLGENRKSLMVRSVGTAHQEMFAGKQDRAESTTIQSPQTFTKGKEYFSSLTPPILRRASLPLARRPVPQS